MARKSTYRESEQRIRTLEGEYAKSKQAAEERKRAEGLIRQNKEQHLGSLPDDCPLRMLSIKCAGNFYSMQLEIGRNASKRNWPTAKDWKVLKDKAEYWDICMGSFYRDAVGTRLRECFVNMGLLVKKRK